jgi:hypothetical protein
MVASQVQWGCVGWPDPWFVGGAAAVRLRHCQALLGVFGLEHAPAVIKHPLPLYFEFLA